MRIRKPMETAARAGARAWTLLGVWTASAGCALLPQSDTEWTLALVITGVAIAVAVVAALVMTLRGKK